jgi:GT2 family glycosyltransferase
MCRVSIIIVAYNGEQWMDKCLQSINAIHQIVVIENGSRDATLKIIRTKYPNVKLLPQTKNLGFGQANNIGISYALKHGADYVFLLNQDAYLEKDTVEKLIEVHKKDETFGILSPIHLNGKGDRLDQNFSHYVNYNANPDFYSDFILKKPLPKVYEVPFVNAAGWLLSKKCLETVGGFDPVFFHYGEDDNYCQRLKYHGFKIGVVPQVFLKHDRETRIFKQDQDGKKGTFSKQERSIKLKYANINKEDFNEVKKLIKKSNKAAIKSLLKLRFKASKFYRMEAVLLKKIYPEIEKSRLLNKTKGSTYLDL